MSISWDQCAIVESVPGKLGGTPVLKDTRMPAQGVVDNYDDGLSPEEIAETFQLRLPDVVGVLEFVGKHRAGST